MCEAPPLRHGPRPLVADRHARASLSPARTRFHLAMDTVAVRPTLPLAGCVEDFHLQVSAPCRAHKSKTRAAARVSIFLATED
jgi:hypothetical protein